MLEIDLASLIPREFLANVEESDVQSLIMTVAQAARAKWIRLASDKLHSSQQEYVKGISDVRFEGGVAFVTLDGVFPNMIEQGFGPYDLRETLLGPNVPIAEGPGSKGKHMTEDGHFYRTISFRMMGGKATGRNAQRTTDVYAAELGEQRAKKLGQLAERKMKKLSPTRSAGGQTLWGESLKVSSRSALSVKGHSHKLIPLGPDAMPGDQPILVPHGGAEHKNPIFQGAYKFEQHYQSATQNSYGTFRTISTASPEGWIHPGHQPGANLAPEANEYALRLLASYFKAFPTKDG